MTLRELQEAKIRIVKKSDLDELGIWNPRYLIDKTEAIQTYRKQGKEAVIESIIKQVKKMGKDNYTSITKISAKEDVNLPSYDIVINNKIKTVHNIIAVFDSLLKHKKIVKKNIENTIKQLQQQLDTLEED